MSERDVYTVLEKAFISTFFDELTPGIFHNFANPLNGVMGRSKLLQKRLTEFVADIKKRYPDVEAEMSRDCAKLVSDIDAINRESERLFALFRTSAWKYSAIGTHEIENLNVSNLIESELGFADFYLDFKHNVKKDIRLDKDVPDISGVTAFYSMAFWGLIRHAMKHIGNGNSRTFFIATDHNDKHLSVKINCIDSHLFGRWQEFFRLYSQGASTLQEGEEHPHICYALMLLKMGNESINIVHDDTDVLTIEIPYRRKKNKN
jgi:hypothetical protein